MPNIIDYLKWRGDIPFSVIPFNDVDNLIFTQLCFVDFTNIVSNKADECISFHLAARKALSRLGPKSKKLGMMIPDEILHLLEIAAVSPRYRNIDLCGFVSFTDTQIETQFAAISAVISENEVVVCFRGTDDSIIGWKEDFNMTLLPNVPSQKMSVNYLDNINSTYPEKYIYVCGHSKGGNLSIYSSVNSSLDTKTKIKRIYNNDGPGFKSEFYLSENYHAVKDKVYTVIPQNSIVGLMFEQDNDSLKVVKSSKNGVFQHDIFSWQVMGTSIEKAVLSKDTVNDKKIFNAWIEGMDIEDRKEAINTIFDFLMSYGATTLTEAISNSPKLLRNYRELPEEKRKLISTAFKIFFHERIKTVIEPFTPLIKSVFKKKDEENTDDPQN